MGFAFVDDTDLITTCPNRTRNIPPLVTSMQHSLDTWQGTLHTTGGALDWSDKIKCYWYCINYIWNRHGKWSYAPRSNDNSITMNDENNN